LHRLKHTSTPLRAQATPRPTAVDTKPISMSAQTCFHPAHFSTYSDNLLPSSARSCQASPTHIPSTTRAGLSMSACTLGDAMPYAHSPQCPSHSPSTCITCRHTTTKPDTPPTLINLHLKPQRFLADPLPPPPIAAPHTTKRNNPHRPRLRTK
jgi:hypothetical protein